MSLSNDVDVAIAGGGLSGTLIGLALKQYCPDLTFVLVEQGASLGGHHTWSFHEPDVSAEILAWLQPLIVHQWQGQSVKFPDYERSLSTRYCSITSERLAEVAGATLATHTHYNRAINMVHEDGLELGDGTKISAKAVIDSRGQGKTQALNLGFQKFVGQEVRFKKPHGLTQPIIMDAAVEQFDGYRFVYVLPFDEQTALVEDTRYTDGNQLNRDHLVNDIADYITANGWEIDNIIREEEGVLPIALGGDFDAFWPQCHDNSGGIARAGMAAALFHPLTGYSLPYAASLAHDIAEYLSKVTTIEGPKLANFTREQAVQRWQEWAFYRLLCRMLFKAAKPDQRYKVLQRFYKLPQPLIERFYAGVSPLKDKTRILVGKPPVPIHKAVRCLRDTS